jgi:putative hemolysin
MIERIFHLGDRNITSLMTHRSDMAFFDITDTELSVRDRIIAEPHSIYPVCEGNIDDMKGIVSIKDLYVAHDLSDLEHLRTLMKPALFVPNNNSAYQVMEKLRATKNYAAFIVDEYGSVLGMITLSDIMEAIIGDMPEMDDVEDYEIVAREDGTFLIDAQINFTTSSPTSIKRPTSMTSTSSTPLPAASSTSHSAYRRYVRVERLSHRDHRYGWPPHR